MYKCHFLFQNFISHTGLESKFPNNSVYDADSCTSGMQAKQLDIIIMPKICVVESNTLCTIEKGIAVIDNNRLH